jgi:electron transfer flavoprotein alpha/beta subunit
VPSPALLSLLKACPARCYGADRAVLLTDRFFAGADTLSTGHSWAKSRSQVWSSD